MNATAPLMGVLPVINTPFDETGAVDHSTLERAAHWIFDQGANGIVVGMVSEFLRLSSDERDEHAEVIVRVAHDRGGASVIGVAAESSHTALRHARVAESLGATAVMASPPLATSLSQSELLGYYDALVSGISLPVIVQDASGYLGSPIGIEALAEMLREFGSRVLFKPEAVPIGSNLSALRDATDGAARIFEGTGGISLIDSFRRGIVGTMPGTDLCWAIVRLWNALKDVRYDDAYRIHEPLASLISMQPTLDCFLAIEKHFLVRQGVFVNEIRRGPVGFTLDRETREEADRLFDSLLAACGLREHDVRAKEKFDDLDDRHRRSRHSWDRNRSAAREAGSKCPAD